VGKQRKSEEKSRFEEASRVVPGRKKLAPGGEELIGLRGGRGKTGKHGDRPRKGGADEWTKRSAKPMPRNLQGGPTRECCPGEGEGLVLT